MSGKSFFQPDHSKAVSSNESAVHLYTLLTVVVIGIVVRMMFLFQPMRYDEAFTFLKFASPPLAEGLSDYSHPNNHLFHTLLVHGAYLALGNRPWVIRLPALFAGVLLIPAGYLTARAFYGKYTALLVAAMISASSSLIEYSTNARGYTLVTLIFIALLVVGASLAQEDKLIRWVAWTVLSAVGFYTIPIMLYPFGVVMGWLCLSILCKDPSFRRGPRIRRLVIALGIVIFLTLALYAPVFLSSGLSPVVANRFVAPKPWDEFAARLPGSLLSVWRQWNRDLPWGIRVVLVAGFCVGSLFHRRLSSYRVPIVVAAAVWLVPVLLLQRVVPFERVWLFLLPLYFMVASAGLVYGLNILESKILRLSFLVAIVSVALSLWLSLGVIASQSVYYSDETGTLRDAEAITWYLQGHLKSGDRILAPVPSDAPLVYYFDHHGISREYLTADLVAVQRIIAVVNLSDHQTLRALLDRTKIEQAEFGAPRMIRRYESAVLYQMDKTGPGKVER